MDRRPSATLPSRILMTADAVGGVWDYAMELTRGLAGLGVSSSLAVMGPPPDEAKRAAAAHIPGLTIDAAPFRLEWMEGAEEDRQAIGDWLLRLERRVRPDIVHVNGYADAALPFRAPVLCIGHSCVLSWWRAVHGVDAPASWSGYAARVAEGLRFADMVTAPTRAMLDALVRHYGPLPHARVLPNGRDPELYHPLTKRPLILAAGRIWDEAKNIGALDAIAGELSWPVCIAGDARGPDGAPKPLCQARHLGRLPAGQLVDWFSHASIFVHPARYEPFGLAPLEAALSGCALVLGDIPSLRELWDGAALFVHPDDRVGLARTLASLIERPDQVAALGSLARQRALTYSATRMVRDTLDLYAALMAKARHPAEPQPLA